MQLKVLYQQSRLYIVFELLYNVFLRRQGHCLVLCVLIRFRQETHYLVYILINAVF